MEHDMSRPVLQTLGIYGLDELEPIILAALAGESTLLLIGDHGSGKSMLLERLAIALDLQWRHYNTVTGNAAALYLSPLESDKLLPSSLNGRSLNGNGSCKHPISQT